MPMWKITMGSGSCSSDDDGSERWQRDQFGAHLAEQILEDELARGSNPGQTLLMILLTQIMSCSGSTPYLLTMS